MESFGRLVVAILCVLTLWSFFITMGRPTRASALQGAATAPLGVACVFVGVLWEGIASTNVSPYHRFTYRLGVISGIAFAVVGAVFFLDGGSRVSSVEAQMDDGVATCGNGRSAGFDGRGRIHS